MDKTTVYELSRFVELRPDVYACEVLSGHDDTVMALVWALYFLKTTYFDGTIIDKTQIRDKYNLEHQYDDAPPIVFDDGGIQTEQIYSGDYDNINVDDFFGPDE